MTAAACLFLLASGSPAFLPSGEAAFTQVHDCATTWWGGAVLIGSVAWMVGGYDIVSVDLAGDCRAYGRQTFVLPHNVYHNSILWDGEELLVFGGASDPNGNFRYADIFAIDTSMPWTYTTKAAALPSGRSHMGSVFDPRDLPALGCPGGCGYLFGGYLSGGTTATDEILRYNPSTDTITVLPAKLPVARAGTAAAFDGQHAYVFSGTDVVRFDPVAGTAATVATLPETVFGAGAAWSGTLVYVAGYGLGASRIVTYDPQTNAVTRIPFEFAAQNSFSGALWYAGRLYLMGVRTNGGFAWETYATFDPSGKDVTLLPARVVPVSAPGLAWDGTRAYLFGGRPLDPDVTGREIQRIEPGSGLSGVQLASTLTNTRETPAAVWAGTEAYVFGGNRVGGYANEGQEILRFRPSPESVTLMSAQLPVRTTGASAAWDGRDLPAIGCAGGCAYVFGGRESWITSSAPLDTILRYHPASDAVTVMNSRLPSARTQTAAAWHGTHAYVFGGTPAGGTQILRFDPATDALVTMTATLPGATVSASAVSTGPAIFVVGGAGTNRIVRYDPATDSVLTMAEPLPHFDYGGTSAVFDGQFLYFIAGKKGNIVRNSAFDGGQVLRYDPDLPPVVEPMTPASVREGSSIVVTVRATDPDGDPVALTASGLPANATFTDLGGGTGRLEWATAIGDDGTHSIQVHATAKGKTATRTLLVTVLHVKDVALARSGPASVTASPGQAVRLLAIVTNAGTRTDTFRFAAGIPASWTPVPPPDATLAPGESRTVELAVTVPPSGTSSLAFLTVRSLAFPEVTRTTNWQVAVPLLVSVQMEDATPSIAQRVRGVVTTTFADGSPTAGAAITVQQSPIPNNPQGLLTSRVAGSTGADGQFVFDFGADPAASFPGTHAVQGSTMRGSATYSAQATYTIGPA